MENQKEKITPKTKEELRVMIKREMDKNGNSCNLNFIDTSRITDMSYLFFDSKFNGDISKWDVSNVKNMSMMFFVSEFNGDLSNWNVGNVVNMSWMFYKSKFNGDLSKWNIAFAIGGYTMFYKCPIKDEYKPKFKDI